MIRVSLLAAAALVAGMCGAASAGTVSGTPFTVQVTVTSGCVINTGPTSTIDFGTWPGTSIVPPDIASSVGVTCTSGSAYTMRFTSVNTVGANHVDRVMLNGVQPIGYQIRAGATAIGDNTATGLGGTGSGAQQNTAINFHINSWTPVLTGLYIDNVTLQVDF